MKKFSRKIAAAAALAITVSSCMTGCFNNTGSGSGSGSSGGNSETVLKVGYTQEPSSFDPADFTIVAATLTGYDCYDTLLNFSHDGTTVEPALAESWEQVDDTTYTYKIRQGVKFSDGNEMTMDDVLYSLNRVTEDNYYMSYLFANVDSFEADNDTWTLTVHLKQPDSSWQYVPATSACTIVEKSVTEEQGDKYGTADGKTVGTGPYKLSSWSSGSEIVLEKNENWWGDPDTLDIDKVEYYVIEDESALALAAKGGQIDFVEGMSNSVMSVYQSCQNFNILSCEGTTSNYIAFNTASKPFDDEWARKAVAYCIDRSQITTTIGGDYAKQSAVVPMSESMMYMDKDKWDSTIAESDVYTQDYDKVKECLAKSKYPDGFEFDFYTTSQTQKQAELLKSMVDASGSITMNLVEVPDSDIFSYMFGYKTKDNGERYYNAVGTYMMSDFLDPMGMLKTLYAGSNACEGGTNETLWTSAEADGLLDKAAQTTDDAEKMGYYTDAYKIFADECPYLGLYTSSDVYAVSDKFTYDPSPMFWYNFSYADVHVAK
jgi:oppA1